MRLIALAALALALAAPARAEQPARADSTCFVETTTYPYLGFLIVTVAGAAVAVNQLQRASDANNAADALLHLDPRASGELSTKASRYESRGVLCAMGAGLAAILAITPRHHRVPLPRASVGSDGTARLALCVRL